MRKKVCIITATLVDLDKFDYARKVRFEFRMVSNDRVVDFDRAIEDRILRAVEREAL